SGGAKLERLGTLSMSRLDCPLQGGFGRFRFAKREMALSRKAVELRVEVEVPCRFILAQDSLNLVEGVRVIAAEDQDFGQHREKERHRDMSHDPGRILDPALHLDEAICSPTRMRERPAVNAVTPRHDLNEAMLGSECNGLRRRSEAGLPILLVSSHH